MAELTLTKTKIAEGVWQGVLHGDVDGNYQPEIEVLHLETPLDGVTVIEGPPEDKIWTVRVPIPSRLLCDGVQTFLIRDVRTGERLESFTIVTGSPLEDDIRAEIDLLRAELDLLKRVFRRALSGNHLT